MDRRVLTSIEELKAYLAKLPLLVEPIPRDTIYIYISSMSQAVSSVLVREEDGVRINTLLKQVLGKPKAFRRLIKWAIELSEYDISYIPRTTIKAQALAYFVFEMMGTTQEEKPWLLHVDASSKTQESGADVVISSPQGENKEFAIKFNFEASNNEVEYEALVLGMRMAQNVGALHLRAYSDSQLIVKQVSREYEANQENMVQYLKQIELKANIKSFQL
ncbi:hypothetical protein Sango_1058400 [Sesamum angolense]|uniref:RNase H type-1 domain-containing protein n=1 Tax=Sesamum angolense TaxID=2727404 RepID=A0AAE1X0Q5_9LAMI|nr:hypothetical protein Sango_1058400 [Sesamum angolense]